MADKDYGLADIATQLDLSPRELRKTANGAVFRDEFLAERIPGSVVRQLVIERDAKRAKEREKRRQQRENRQPNPVVERVKAIQAAQAGLPSGAHLPLHESAAARARAADAPGDDAFQAADEKMRDWTSGRMTVRPLRRP